MPMDLLVVCLVSETGDENGLIQKEQKRGMRCDAGSSARQEARRHNSSCKKVPNIEN